MKKSIFTRGLAALAVCALVLPVVGSSKNPVERPYKGQSTITWIVSMVTGSAVGQELGVATHVGRYTNEATAVWDLNHFVILSGSGIVTAANGDQAFWTMTADQPGVVQVDGGTGRFENVTGSLTAVPPLEPIVTLDMATMTMTITVTYSSVGALTY